MNYIGKFISNFREFYNEINSATLTGAIDVIVIEQPDGSFCSSPFHVRFGKMGVLRSREKIVDIEVNGEPVDLHMKLGDTGEAFFVEEVKNEDDQAILPSYLATSPIPDEVDTNYLENEINKLKLKYNLEKENTIDNDDETESEIEAKKNLTQNQTTTIKEVQTSSDINNINAFSYNSFLIDSSTFNQDQSSHSTQKDATSTLDNSDEQLNDNKICKSIGIQTEDNVFNSDKVKKIQTPSSANLLNSHSKKRRRKKSSIKKPTRNSSKENLLHTSNQFNSHEYSEELFYMEDDWEEDNSTIITGEPNSSMTRSISVPTSASSNNKFKSKQQYSSPSLSDIHPYSDGEMTPFLTNLSKARKKSRPSTPKSDTEYEISRNDATSQTESEEVSWEWGELPQVQKKISLNNNYNVNSISLEFGNNSKSMEDNKNIETQDETKTSVLEGVLSFIKTKDESNKSLNSTDVEKGIFLDDLNPDDLDPNLADLYFPKLKSSMPLQGPFLDDDVESGNGSSIPHSPHFTSNNQLNIDSDLDQDKMVIGSCDSSLIENIFRNISISTCGGLEEDNITSEKFDQSLVSYEEFCAKSLEILKNSSLVFRIDGRYYNWSSAAPIILSLILYNKPLPIHSINLIIDQTMIKKKEMESKSSWWYWRRSAASSPKIDESSNVENKDLEMIGSSLYSDKNNQTTFSENTVSTTVQTNEMEMNNVKSNDFLSKSDIEDCKVIIINNNNNNTNNSNKDSNVQYRKVLRISSEQIKNLYLVQGRNEVVFSVTTAYQGTTRCKCSIYLWRYDDKIVVSDIDGTITKSDILGHILPVIGNDWAQSGVANLFDKIQENGYKLLYLSARAIGQAKITREYLRSVKQGNICLPDGPLLLSPTSLISAFHREVIEKKPEEFKISCLKDIKALFPTNPFYAGFGNKINDTWAYRAMDIPLTRIFTINHKGEIKLEMIKSFYSSYTRLSDVVDQMFPPVSSSSNKPDFLSEYSSFNFWRDPIIEIPPNDLIKTKI